MTLRDYINEKLDAMATRPQMWAGTREGFVLTLVTMMELLFYDRPTPTSGIRATSELMHRLCGPSNFLVQRGDDVEQPWARERVDITRKFIEEHAGPR